MVILLLFLCILDSNDFFVELKYQSKLMGYY